MFASLHTSTLTVRHVQARGTFASSATSLIAKLRAAMIAKAQRKQLLQLDAYRLADIGLTAEQAEIEAARPLWDVPATWRRGA